MAHGAEQAAGAAIYTIGHSNQSLDALIDLLRMHAIEVVVDVRSQPYSRYSPHFSRGSLEPALVAAGFKYLFMGKELGGRPQGAEFYDAEGRVRYGEVEKSELFQGGIARVETGIQRYRVALLCSEEDPAGCHRRLLVGRVLAERGTALLHIRSDGRVEREERVRSADDERDAGQLPLFAEIDEMREWKSISALIWRGRAAASPSTRARAAHRSAAWRLRVRRSCT